MVDRRLINGSFIGRCKHQLTNLDTKIWIFNTKVEDQTVKRCIPLNGSKYQKKINTSYHRKHLEEKIAHL